MPETLEVINPATEETFKRIDLHSADEIEERLVRASSAARQWRGVPMAERIAVTHRFVEAFTGKADEIAAELTAQMGKPITQARNEIKTMAARARYMAEIAEASLADVRISEGPDEFKRIVRDPLGVILDIAAWNYPLLIAVNVVTPGILAGNAVVLKHSSLTPLCGLRFEEAYRSAGLPDGVMTAIVADRTRAEAVLGSPHVDAVFFTGSVEGGRRVYQTACGGLIDVGLELGGKDPAYVRADADLAKVVPNVADACFYNAGQSCCAVERVYVHRSAYDAFLEAMLREVRGYRMGDPTDPDTYLGPVAMAKTIETMDRQLAEVVDRGARLLCGGKPASVGGHGRYYEATVVADCANDMAIMQEENFGPLVGVMPVADDDEAIRLMNDSRYGLSASIWTRDVDEGRRLAEAVEAGTVFVNRADFLDPALAWVGVKDSGKGCTLSQLGYNYLTRPKSYYARSL
ncbi:MAG: aldehyde dehydrogenase family protein [Phycisphaerae bacterium]|nr:aldehyde dehydrogenase family protein [Phycisphaerae bacterium]